jgi:hypothetical protein
MVVVVAEAIQITVQALPAQVVEVAETTLQGQVDISAAQLLIQDKEIPAATQVQANGEVDQAVELAVQV